MTRMARLRMAGEDPEVERLLLADKYRYLERDDYPTEAYLVADDDSRYWASPEEYKEALETASMGDPRLRQSTPYTPEYEATQASYEQAVAARFRALRERFPQAAPLQLLEMAL